MVKPEIKFKPKEHSFILGQTQSGKTYATSKLLLADNIPYIFINPQKEKIQGIKMNYTNDAEEIKRTLKSGYSINYIPSLNDDVATEELKYIIDYLFTCNFNKNKPVRVVIDETHIFSNSKTGKNAIKKIANRGLTYGLNAIFISQRGANVEYTALTQAKNHYIFSTLFEKEYFTRKGLDFNKIKNVLSNKKYHFIIYNGLEVKGPYKV